MTIQFHDIDAGQERLRALRRAGLLASPAPADFLETCRLAQARFAVPVALVSLLADDRLIVAAAAGTAAADAPRLGSFCDQAVRGDEVLVVPDARRDPRFSALPAVSGPPFFRFYAGAPLAHVRGVRLGALCLLDTRPRDLSPSDRAELERMADGLMGAVLERQFEGLAARTIG